MNKRILLVFVFIMVACFATAAAQTYRLPHIANGANAIQTTFIFFNNGDATAVVNLTLTNDDGNPLNWTLIKQDGGTLTQAGFMLASGQTIIARSSGSGPLQTGAARVTSTQPIGVSAVFSLLNPNGSVKTEAGIGVSPEVTEFVIAVDTVGVFNTGLAIFNSGGAEADLTFQLFDEDGNPRSSLAERNDIPVNGHLAVFVDGQQGLFPQLGDFKGRMVVTSNSPVSGLTLRQNIPLAAPLTTLPVVSPTSSRTSFTLPHVANAGNIKTQFVFFNLGSQAGTAIVDFTNDNGQPMSVTLDDGRTGSSFNIAVAGNGATFIETNGAGELKIGAVRVQSTVPMGVSAIFSILNAQGQTTVEAGVGDSPSFAEFSVPIDMTEGKKTGLALFNNSGGTVTLEFQARNADGNLLATRTYRQAPDSMVNLAHLARFADQLIAETAGRVGQLGVFASGPISAIGLRQFQASGILTTVPISPDVPGEGNLPAGTELLGTQRTGIDLTSNTDIGTTTLETGFELSGDVNYPSNFFPTGGVTAIDGQGKIYTGSVSFDFQGGGTSYSVIVPRGTFRLQFCGSGIGGSGMTSAKVPLQLGESSILFLGHREEGVVVTGETSRDITVEDVNLTDLNGQVGNLNELPESALDNGLTLVLSSENSPVQSVAQVQSDGSYQAEVGSGDYTATLFFGEGTDTNGDGQIDTYERAASLFDIGRTTVSSSGTFPLATANFSVPNLVSVSGTITQPDTADFDDSAVFAGDPTFIETALIEQCFPAVGASFTNSDQAGDYTIRLIQNRAYNIFATVPATSIGTDEQGGVFSPYDNRRTFSTDSNLDLNVPGFPQEVQVSGKVVDDQGQPVEGVTVSIFTENVTGAANTAFTTDTTTNAQGNFSVTVLSGTNYRVEFDPPRDSGGTLPFSDQ